MFPDKGSPYYYHLNLSKKTGQRGSRLKQPEVTWSADADRSVAPDMTQEKWEQSGERFPRYHTSELKASRVKNRLLSKLDKLLVQNIL